MTMFRDRSLADQLPCVEECVVQQPSHCIIRVINTCVCDASIKAVATTVTSGQWDTSATHSLAHSHAMVHCTQILYCA